MKPRPAWPEGLAPPLPDFRPAPLGCMARMEARENEGLWFLGSPRLGPHPPVLRWFHQPIPLPEASGSPHFVPGHQDSQQKSFYRLCNNTPHPALRRGFGRKKAKCWKAGLPLTSVGSGTAP